jgi:hypothetical protein
VRARVDSFYRNKNYYDKMEENTILQQYTREELYSCFLETAKILGMNSDSVIDALDNTETYKGIKKYIKYYSLNLNHPSRNLRVLSGPNIIWFYRNVQGKRIMLLGERHTIQTICNDQVLSKRGSFEVQDWLIQLGWNAPSCVDIFVESYYKASEDNCHKKGKLATYKDPLSAIRCDFKIHGNIPPYVRYHDIDLRIIEGIEFPMFTWFILTRNKSGFGLDYIKVVNKYKKYTHTLINYMLTADKSQQAKLIYNEFASDMFQIIDIPYSENKYNSMFDKYTKLIDKEFSKSELDRDKTLETLSSVYINTLDMWNILMNIPMDLYFLIRLFVKFDSSKLQRGPTGCRTRKDVVSNNVIVYSGSNHSLIYANFINNYFNKVPTFMLGDRHNQCIEFTSSSKSAGALDKPFDFFTY